MWSVFLHNRPVGLFVIEGSLVLRPAQAASTAFSFALTGEWYPGNECTRVILGAPGKEPLEREVAFRKGRWILPDQGADDASGPYPGVGEMNERIHGDLPFTWMDLLMPYLQWPDIRYAGPGRHLGRPAQTYELRNPDPDAFPFRVVVSLDEDFAAILASDFYDADGFLSRRMRVAGFKRFDGQWMFSQISWEDRKARSSVRLEVYSFSTTK